MFCCSYTKSLNGIDNGEEKIIKELLKNKKTKKHLSIQRQGSSKWKNQLNAKEKKHIMTTITGISELQ